MIDTKELRKLVHRHAQVSLSIPIKPAMLSEILDSLEAAEKERDALRAEVIHIKEVEFPRKAQAVADGWRGKCERLEAKITEMERPATSVPDGWLRAIDEALVTAHIGVANAEDTYEQAKAKLANLLEFHVAVATDPAVNGGWKLVPIEPTPMMINHVIAERLHALVDGKDHTFIDIYKDMISITGGQAMKLCVYCRHCVDKYVAFDSCARSVRTCIDMRDGSEIKTGWRTASLEREDGAIMARLNGSCGKEGRFWEAKP